MTATMYYMMEKSGRQSLLTNNRARMSLCIQISVLIHSWIFLSVSSNAQAQAIRHEKSTLLQALAYARRAGVDVSAYQQTLKEPPFEPGFESRMEIAKAVHSKLGQMIDQVNREISRADADKVAASRDGVLIVDTGGANTLSHALLIHPDGKVDYTVDNIAAPIGSGRMLPKHGGSSGNTKIAKEQAEELFELMHKLNIPSLPANAILPDREDGNYLVPQIVYVDFADQTSPNLLCATSKEGQQLVDCCRKIETATKINKLAYLSAKQIH